MPFTLTDDPHVLWLRSAFKQNISIIHLFRSNKRRVAFFSKTEKIILSW